MRETRTVVVTVWRVVAGNTAWRGAGRLLVHSVVLCLAVCEVWTSLSERTNFSTDPQILSRCRLKRPSN